MKKTCSRRDFVVKGTLGLGAAIALDLGGLSTMGEQGVGQALAAQGTREETMPHVSVKLWPGRSEEDKQRLADAIVQDVIRHTGASESSISVSIEDVPSGEWREKVYEPEIRAKEEYLYKKPGYSM